MKRIVGTVLNVPRLRLFLKSGSLLGRAKTIPPSRDKVQQVKRIEQDKEVTLTVVICDDDRGPSYLHLKVRQGEIFDTTSTS